MNVVVVGCGKIGRCIAEKLDRWGYEVAVVDNEPALLEAFDEDFEGIVVQGVPFDKEVLENAGCGNADVVLVVTSDDNVNIMATHVINEYFGVDVVYTRIMDLELEGIYRGFGFKTICPTRMVTDSLFNVITQDDADVQMLSFAMESVCFVMIRADREKNMVGKHVSEIKMRDNEMLFAIQKRTGELYFADKEDFIIEAADTLIVAAIRDAGGRSR